MAGGVGRLGLQQQLLVVVVRRQHAEGVRGRLGRAKRRRARIVQHAPQRAHAGIAHETGHHRFLGGGRDLRQFARDGRHVGQRIGGQQHQHAIHPGVVQHGLQHGADAVGSHRQIGDDRIGDGRVRFQHRRQRALRGGRQFRAQHCGVGADQVHGQLRWPAAVGDQRDTAALRAPRVAQHLHRREELHEVAHADGARAAQGGVEDGVAAVGIGAAGLQHDHGLDAGRRAQRAHELPGGAHVFEVEHDAVRARIAGQVIQQLRQTHHRLVTERHRRGKADVHVFGPVHDGGHDGARLRHQRHAPGARQHRVLAEVQARVRPLRAKGTRAKQFATVFFCPCPAQGPRTARIRVGQWVRQQNHRTGRQRRQPAQGFGQHGWRYANQGQIGPRPRRQAFQRCGQFRRGARFAIHDRGFRLERGRQRARRRQGPVGNDHQRTGFEHRGKRVSQHREGRPNLKYRSS
ncbi:hypothetical protein D3C72_492850 [compost metagenome]